MTTEKTGLITPTKIIFERSRPGRRGVFPPAKTTPCAANAIPSGMLRRSRLRLPEVSQPDVVRHFVNLSRKNFSVDTVFYPLGSCTMKHNPRINEVVASQQEFCVLHPMLPDEYAQGMLEICHETARALSVLTGFPGISLQPAAGAHGELTSMLIMNAYFRNKGGDDRRIILIPDTAHGTNPASAHYAGFTPKTITSGADGNLDPESIKPHLGPGLAGIMITNPNTLGLFEKRIIEVCRLVHDAGGLVYMDGANFNAIMGMVRPADCGADIMHLNLHKTFSTPHGGGGPGAGPIAVTSELEPFLPFPMVARAGDGSYFLDYNRPLSMGRIRAFYGNLSVVVRAWAYIRTLGFDGLRDAARTAVLNANYLRKKITDTFDIPYADHCMHEFVISLAEQKKRGSKALDFAKALIDFSIHPPTIYFPLIVHEAMMIEPTETESPENLDRFAEIMKMINEVSRTDPDSLAHSPVSAPIFRPDELTVARNPILVWPKEDTATPGGNE